MRDETTRIVEEIGQLLLALHKLPQQVEFSEFQNHALELLAEKLPFDSAWWGLASGLNIHTELTHNLPDTYREAWETVKANDPIATATSENPFLTACFNEKDLQDSPDLQATLGEFGIRHVLCTQTQEPELGLFAFLSLYRSGPAFTERERLIKQTLMPHLIHALHLSWRKHLLSALYKSVDESQLAASAVVDASGLIYSAEDLFARFMLIEWPRWTGPMLPEELCKALHRNSDFRGRKIRGSMRDVSGLILVRISERKRISELTPRELSVAELYSSGKSHKEIAIELEIAPSTVRHYIRTVFSKLHITNKSELTRLFFSTSH